MPTRPLTFTLDLEDHRSNPTLPARYPTITRRILDFLDERAIRATVFVLGEIAREAPELIREIAARGHEIAYHTEHHVHLNRQQPAEFKRETAAGIAYLADLVGRPVLGFRAPAFSLTRQSLWAVEVLAELGFVYSSSVLPISNPLFGFPGAPQRPFRWPNGLLEIPAPVAARGAVGIPFLGGIYLRYFPLPLIRLMLDRCDPAQHFWLYCHPHDFDAGAPFQRIRGTSWAVSALLWFNRRRTFTKLSALYRGVDAHSASPLIEQVHAGDFADVPSYREFTSVF